MRIIKDLKDHLEFVNQETLLEEKKYLQREIQFFESKVQTIKDQILKTQVLDDTQNQELETELQSLVEQVRVLVNINYQITHLQSEVLTTQELCNKRQAELYEIFIYIEDTIQANNSHYQSFDESSFENYIDFTNEFEKHVTKQSSQTTFSSIKSRLASMQRKAVQFSKSNQKLEIATQNLNEYLQTVQSLELLVNIKTPLALNELQSFDAQGPEILIGEITPILQNIHETNLEEIRVLKWQEMQEKQEQFNQKLSVLKSRLQFVLLLSALPVLILAMVSRCEQIQSNSTKSLPTKAKRRPNLRPVFDLENQRLRFSNEDLRSLEESGIYFKDTKLEVVTNTQEQLLEQATREFELFSTSLLQSSLLNVSTPQNVHLYSYQGATRIHYLFFKSKSSRGFEAFELTNENPEAIKHAVDTLFGEHQSLTLYNYSYNPDSQLKQSAISRKLY